MSQSFDDLVKEYHQLVMSLIYRYYGGRLGDRAEDLSQEIWTRLWESFKKNERNIVSFKSYLYRTVQTTLWDAVRALDKERRNTSIEEVEPSEEPGDDQLHQRLALQDMLDTLKPDEARMMRAHLKGFNAAEIATMLGTSEGRVRNLLSRTRKKLMLMGGSNGAPDLG